MTNTWNDQWVSEQADPYWTIPDNDVVVFIRSLAHDLYTHALDFGCGIGRHSILMAQWGLKVTSVDTSPNAIAYLQQWAQNDHLDITTIVGDLTSIDQTYYDVIVSYNVLYHGTREALSTSLRHLSRHLKPNGFLYFTCPTRDDGKYDYGHCVEPHTYLCDKALHQGDIHYFTDEADLRDLVQDLHIANMTRDEQYWDNHGTQQFSSNLKVICQKC